jgi:hypothetical protein
MVRKSPMADPGSVVDLYMFDEESTIKWLWRPDFR